MAGYIIKRLLGIIPILFIITWLGFFMLSQNADNAVNSYLSSPNNAHVGGNVAQQKIYWKKKLGYDLPLFYFSVNPLSENINSYKRLIPIIQWNGTANQYNRWLLGSENSKGIIRGDFGKSYKTNEPVMQIIKERVGWSIFFSLSAIIIAYLISIPLGITLAKKKGTRFYKWTTSFLLFMYSMPPFFIGILLVMIFANTDVLNWLPASGIKPIEGYEHSSTLLQKITNTIPYIILPMVCYVYSSISFITHLTEASINEQLTFDYIRTAKAKGLSHHQIIYKHALKNSVLPLITTFSSIFPSVIGGSIIIETLFSIPGMGNQTVQAILAHDYPIVIAIVTLTSIITLISYILTDIVYVLVDKRIKLDIK